MSAIMRMSELYVPTLKEDPADAEIASHRLLMRAGMIRKTASGVYTFLPLGQKVLAKVEHIVREEMNAIGAQEIMMPALQPAELWHESGRWDDYGPELMRCFDRHDHGFCLGPTHEELITALVRNELRSYKELPMTLYQIQVKFRDEIRPRFGLLRAREFIMKDAYSFHASQESLQEVYDAMSAAYGRICERLDLSYRAVEADSGQIGGSVSTEFMALAEAGEAELVYCECGYAADTEAAECKAHPTPHEVAFEKIATPGIHTIDALAAFVDIPHSATVKALVGAGEAGEIVAFFIPGDHELNEIKAGKVVSGFRLLTDEEMKGVGLVKGSIGPIGLPQGVRVVCDCSLQTLTHWVVGANEDGFHYVGAHLGSDFQVSEWADLCTTKPGDVCPQCGLTLAGARGIEVSQVFQLGTKYSKAMGATFTDENGIETPFVMGCYGVGVSRSLAAVVEQHNDKFGMSWPLSIAPAHVCIIPLTVGDELVQPTAETIAADMASLGFEVVIDDRSERAGVKFADADLIGWPLQIIVGARSLAEGKIELKRRRTGERRDLTMAMFQEFLAFIRQTKACAITGSVLDKLFLH